jgi:hypothetical protein
VFESSIGVRAHTAADDRVRFICNAFAARGIADYAWTGHYVGRLARWSYVRR